MAYLKELTSLETVGEMEVVDAPEGVTVIPTQELFSMKYDNINGIIIERYDLSREVTYRRRTTKTHIIRQLQVRWD